MISNIDHISNLYRQYRIGFRDICYNIKPITSTDRYQDKYCRYWRHWC